MRERKDLRVSGATLIVIAFVVLTIMSLSTILTTGYSSYSVFEGDLAGSCDPCHPPGNFAGLNDYGTDFEAEAGHSSDPAAAINAIMAYDSDGDGFINKHEIENGSNPGDSADIPSNEPKFPDLEIIKVDRSSKESFAGESLFVYVYIHNAGDADAKCVNVSLLDNTEIVQRMESISIKKEETRYVIFDIIAEEGVNKYLIEAEYCAGVEHSQIYVYTPEPHPDWLQDGLPNPLPAPGIIPILICIGGLVGIIRLYKRRDA